MLYHGSRGSFQVPLVSFLLFLELATHNRKCSVSGLVCHADALAVLRLAAEGRQALILDGVMRAGARIGPDPRLILDQAYLIKRSHDTPKKGIKLIYYDF